MMTNKNAGALAGLRVVELGQLIAGPFCGQLLGDMGADVIKIEPPVVGDPMRTWGNGEHKVWWKVIGRNKRSVTANLRVPEGQDLARRLLADADIVIENFKPGPMDKWGLGWDALRAIKPDLIYCHTRGHERGPRERLPGNDQTGACLAGVQYEDGGMADGERG